MGEGGDRFRSGELRLSGGVQGSWGKSIIVHDGGSSTSEIPRDNLSSGGWPTIREGIQSGMDAQRRLTLIPRKFSDWCKDASGYHPMTRLAQKLLLRLQIEDDIKRHMFSDKKKGL